MTEALVGSETVPEAVTEDTPVVADAEVTEADPSAEVAEVEDPKPESFTFQPTLESGERVYPRGLVAEFGSEDKFREWLNAPIVVIKANTLIPKGCERWFFAKLRDKVGLDQPKFWLDQAEVPELLQERILLLSDDDFTRFFTDWQQDSLGATPGE